MKRASSGRVEGRIGQNAGEPGTSAQSKAAKRETQQQAADFINEETELPLKRSRSAANWSTLARKLRQFLHNQREPVTSLGLFSVVPENGQKPDISRADYTISLPDTAFSVRFTVAATPESLDILTGFDNTGNVRLWPGGESLAFYLHLHPELVRGRRCLELGSGYLGLPGLVSGLAADCVCISDGNEVSVNSVERIIWDNHLPNVYPALIRWDAPPTHEQYDVILAADCVFFEKSHSSLLNALDTLLSKDGVVYLASPKRKGSLERFLDCLDTDARFVRVFDGEFDRMIESLPIASEKLGDCDRPYLYVLTRD